eukprot:GHVH01006243.1.p1 GENE.GHVH01006243.1~~GHVH01006243.1.p1  ORF type:complete len:392 (-),score=38.27 GHVH01006243.1:171-1346(-)
MSYFQRQAFGQNSNSTGFGTSTTGGTHTRVELPSGPPDSVSAVAWSTPSGPIPTWKQPKVDVPQVQRVAVASWDGTVRIYDVRMPSDQHPPQVMAVDMITIQGPVLDVALDSGALCFTAGADGAIRMHDIASKQVKELGKHEGPVTFVRYDPASQTVISGGVDGFLKAFNSGGQCVHQAQLTGLIRGLDVRNSHIAALCSDNSIHVLNTQTNQTVVLQEDALKLTHLQMTTVTILPAPDTMKDSQKQIAGVIVGAVDGRLTVHSVQTFKYSSTNQATYNFAAHPTTHVRKANKDVIVHQVSAADINHRGLVVTAGSDGALRFWDVANKCKKSEVETPNKHPIVATKFDPYGQMVCYATSYDWSAGAAGHTGSVPTKIYIHTIKGVDPKNII